MREIARVGLDSATNVTPVHAAGAVTTALQAFTRDHGLPTPILKNDHDGQHCFVYSHTEATTRLPTSRYAYSLTWAEDRPCLLWIMLNPGTGETDGRRRNTFERCKAWSRELGFGGLLFGNVFAFRTKSARDLLNLSLPPDPVNEHALQVLTRLATRTVVAWGNHGAKSDRAQSLGSLLSNPVCFGLTKAGHPRHPLYVPSNTPLVPWGSATPSRASATQ